MNQDKAKKQLRRMLRSFTAGSILDLLAGIFHQEAEQARRAGDELNYRRCHSVEVTLIVVGLGIDAANPR